MWWSRAERRSDATELPVCRVFLSRQIAAAIAVEVQKPAVQGCRGPVFVDLNMGLGLLLSVLFLSINRSLSPLTPLAPVILQPPVAARSAAARLAAVVGVSSGNTLLFFSLYFFFFSFFLPSLFVLCFFHLLSLFYLLFLPFYLLIFSLLFFVFPYNLIFIHWIECDFVFFRLWNGL